MISPGGIPQIPGDMDALAGHATALSGLGGSFASTGERVNTTWQQLAPVYDAPEVGRLLAATGPVQTTSASVGEDISAVGAALATYAATVRAIKAQLESLRSQAQAFVDENGGNDDWEEDDGKVDRNNQLVEAVNAQVAAFYEAQRTCANTINALYGGIQYRADDGDGQVSPGEYGYTAEQLGAAAGQDGALPWGSTQEHDRGLLGDVGSFLGGIGEGAVNFVTDLGALIGRDPTTGEWSWGTAGTAWAGLGKFALAVGMTMNNPGMLIRGDSPAIPGIFAEGEASALVLGAGKSIIAYDEWGQGDDSRAAGMATFNVASAIIGTKGAGAALRGGGTAAQASRIGAVSRAGTAMIRGGEFLGRLPTTESLALRAQQALPSLRLSDFGSLGRVDVPHHTDTPRPDAPSVEVPRADTPNPGSVGDNLANHAPSVDTPSTPGADVPGQRGDHSPAPQAEAPDPVAAARQDTAGAAERPGGHDGEDAPGSQAAEADSVGEPALVGNGTGEGSSRDTPSSGSDTSNGNGPDGAPNDGTPDTTSSDVTPGDTHTPQDDHLGDAPNTRDDGGSGKGVDAMQAATRSVPPPSEGQRVWRVYGQQMDGAGHPLPAGARPFGQSWTPVDPTLSPNYRRDAGLPNENPGRFFIEGMLRRPEDVTEVRPALPLDGNPGGWPEYVIENSEEAVDVTRVGGVNEPWTQPPGRWGP